MPDVILVNINGMLFVLILQYTINNVDHYYFWD